jgi:hypothetical protein
MQTKRAVILNSRASKIILGADPWIRAVMAAIDHANYNEQIILTSIGLSTWEFILNYSRRIGVRCAIYIPQGVNENNIIKQFKLEESLVSFVKLDVPQKGKSWWRIRDRKIFEDADVIYPISIRPNGNFEGFLKELEAENSTLSKTKELVDIYRVTYDESLIERVEKPKLVNAKDLTKKTKIFESWNYLTHWTHTTYEPWCNETKAEFYDSIISSDKYYSHSAFNSLCRIIDSQKICATQEKTRSKTKFVSFTELNPIESIELMHWRKGLVRFYLEPYGIAINRDKAFESAVKPVIYTDTENYDNLPKHITPLFQPIKGKRYYWTDEREWRFISDFNLNNFDNDSILIIVRHDSEKTKIKKRVNLQVIALESFLEDKDEICS